MLKLYTCVSVQNAHDYKVLSDSHKYFTFDSNITPFTYIYIYIYIYTCFHTYMYILHLHVYMYVGPKIHS